MSQPRFYKDWKVDSCSAELSTAWVYATCCTGSYINTQRKTG